VRLPRSLLAVAALTVLSGHVAPSVDDNNRYLKLTPLGDRVRLAYTVFFGEVPGASERRGIDRDHDGQISDREARAFGDKVAAQIQAALDVEVDGKMQPVSWATTDVGLGTPSVAAGSFSVDLVAYFCLAPVRGKHHVLVHDRFRIPRPGETEAKVEDSPGVTIERARVGVANDPTYDYRFAGPGGPLETDGLDLAFDAGPRAPVVADGTCPEAATPATAHGGLGALGWLAIGGGIGLAFAVTLGVLRRVRARA